MQKIEVTSAETAMVGIMMGSDCYNKKDRKKFKSKIRKVSSNMGMFTLVNNFLCQK